MKFRGTYRAGGQASHYARITAANGSGSATGVDGEGKYIQQADVSSITLTVIDKTSKETVIDEQSLTVSQVLLDTPVSSTQVWTQGGSYNFKHDMPAGSFPDPNHVYWTRYTITLTGGLDPVFLIFEGPAKPNE